MNRLTMDNLDNWLNELTRSLESNFGNTALIYLKMRFPDDASLLNKYEGNTPLEAFHEESDNIEIEFERTKQ